MLPIHAQLGNPISSKLLQLCKRDRGFHHLGNRGFLTVHARASVLVWPSPFENLCFCLCFAVFVDFELVFDIFGACFVVFELVFVFVFAEILFPQKDERTRTDTLRETESRVGGKGCAREIYAPTVQDFLESFALIVRHLATIRTLTVSYCFWSSFRMDCLRPSVL